MEYRYYFERLDVWQKARLYAKHTYDITNSKFPTYERFGLTSQLQRCAVSVSSNIAEGVSRKTPKEKLRFFEIAYSSLMESLSQWYVAIDQHYIEDEKLTELKPLINEIANKINALAREVGKNNE